MTHQHRRAIAFHAAGHAVTESIVRFPVLTGVAESIAEKVTRHQFDQVICAMSGSVAELLEAGEAVTTREDHALAAWGMAQIAPRDLDARRSIIRAARREAARILLARWDDVEKLADAYFGADRKRPHRHCPTYRVASPATAARERRRRGRPAGSRK